MSGPLRIGYLVQQFPPEVGAGPARVAEMALRWRAAGAEVTVITAMPNRPVGRIRPEYRGRLFVEERWEGIRVLRSWLYASPEHGFARTVLNNTTFLLTGAAHAIARAGPLDVLIASSPPFFVHAAGDLAARIRRVPLVLEVRDLWPDYLVDMGVVRGRGATALLFAVERFLFRASARIVVVTESFRELVAGKGIEPDRIDVVPNGVDTRAYFAEPAAPPIPELERRPGELVVGYLGNFGAGQALGAVVEAAALLERRSAPLRFVLVGDGPERAAVTARARELQVSSVSIRGPIPKSRTRAFHNACDVCLVPLAPFPVLRNTVPSKLFEIMACERPVLASLAGEGARVVEESGGGHVVPPGDAAAIARGIERLASLSQDERRELGRRGRAYVSRHYDRDALARSYLERLRRVAGRRPRTEDGAGSESVAARCRTGGRPMSDAGPGSG